MKTPVPHTSIANCNFTVEAVQVNEFTYKAIEALAKASETHAEALIAMANALRGGNATMGHAIYIGAKYD